LVSWALLWFAAGLVGHAIMEVLTRAFYAQHDTRTPVIIGTAAMGLNVILSFGFAELFRQIGWMPHGGLALANSLATALEATALFIVMRKRLNGIEGSRILLGSLQASGGTLAMGLILLLWLRLITVIPPWLLVLGGITAGGLTYALILTVLRVPEVRGLLRFVQGRILRT